MLLGLSPGPDNLFVLVQSAAQRGWRVGLCVVLGLCLGIVGHTAAVALGLAAAGGHIAHAVHRHAQALQRSLSRPIWPGVHGMRRSAPKRKQPGRREQRDVLTLQLRHGWVGRGVIMNLTNPKVLIFFLAFAPGFADPFAAAWASADHGAGQRLHGAARLVFGSIASVSQGSLARSRNAPPAPSAGWNRHCSGPFSVRSHSAFQMVHGANVLKLARPKQRGSEQAWPAAPQRGFRPLSPVPPIGAKHAVRGPEGA